MKQVFKRPEALVDVPFHFCPGCHHGIVHRLVAECIDRYGLRDRTIGVASVGCSVFLYDYMDVDVVEVQMVQGLGNLVDDVIADVGVHLPLQEAQGYTQAHGHLVALRQHRG